MGGALPGIEGGQGQGCWRHLECPASGCWRGRLVVMGQVPAVMGTEFRGQSFRDRGPCSSDATVIRAPSPLLDRGEHLKL